MAMARDRRPATALTGLRTAHIVVAGEFGPLLAASLPEAEISTQSGKTLITAKVRDEAELFAVLQRLRDLGAALVNLTFEA